MKVFWKKKKEEDADTNQTENNLGKIRFRLIFTYALLILIAVVGVTSVTLNITFRVMQDKTSSLLTSFNTQMNESIRQYFYNLQGRAAVIFADPQNYRFDPTVVPDSEEKEQILSEIAEDIRFVGLTENYSDFAVLYRDGEVVGRVSDGTKKLFGDKLFEEMDALTSEDGRHDGVLAGYNGDYRRIYYTNRVNDNAVLVVSLYALDLDDLFSFSQDVRTEMAVRLVDDKNYVIYSSENDEIGQSLPEEMLATIADHSSVSISDSSYMYNIKTSVYKWRVISTIPMETMRKEYQSVRLIVGLVAIAVVFLSVMLARFLSNSITNPLNNLVYGLSEKAEFDLLTGIYNKMTFERYAEELIADPETEGSIAYFLSDVDDFKKVNDVCGHSVGDRVLQKYGRILADIYHKDLPGRIGGDEFAAVVLVPPEENPYVYMGERIKNIRRRVRLIHEDNADIHVSIGVAICKDKSTTITDLYRRADKALYETKRRGKDGYTFYDAAKMGDDETGGEGG